MAKLFIVGVGRSGTSLLQSMFAAHSAVAMLPETSFFRRYATGAASIPETHRPREAWESVYNRDERLQRIHRECWNRAVELSDLGGDSDVRRVAQVGRVYRNLLSSKVAGCQAGRSGASISYTGDKDPRLIEFLPLIKELFPESHIVHIVRDPRDVLLSKGKAAWSRSRGWHTNLAIGRFQLDLGDRFGRELWGWRYHVVRYEDLLEQPERTLRRLTAELDLSFEPEMLEFGTAAQRLGGGTTEEWKKETLGPLLKTNTGKWRRELPSRQIRLVEAVYQGWMRRYGYEPMHTATGPVQGAARFLYGTVSTLYGWYRRAKVRRILIRLRG